MDPQETWDQLLTAYAEGDWDRIEELATALSEWLRKGGFPPTVLGQPGLGAEFEQALAQAGCDFCLETLNARWASTSTGDGE
ncbi:MAG: hypothetical protein U0793_11125 [Gemmataceae bacterium]